MFFTAPLPAIPNARPESEIWGEGAEDRDSIYESIDELEYPGLSQHGKDCFGVHWIKKN